MEHYSCVYLYWPTLSYMQALSAEARYDSGPCFASLHAVTGLHLRVLDTTRETWLLLHASTASHVS